MPRSILASISITRTRNILLFATPSIMLENLRPRPVRFMTETIMPAQAVDATTTSADFAASTNAAINSLSLAPPKAKPIITVTTTEYTDARIAVS